MKNKIRRQKQNRMISYEPERVWTAAFSLGFFSLVVVTSSARRRITHRDVLFSSAQRQRLSSVLTVRGRRSRRGGALPMSAAHLVAPPVSELSSSFSVSEAVWDFGARHAYILNTFPARFYHCVQLSASWFVVSVRKLRSFLTPTLLFFLLSIPFLFFSMLSARSSKNVLKKENTQKPSTGSSFAILIWPACPRAFAEAPMILRILLTLLILTYCTGEACFKINRDTVQCKSLLNFNGTSKSIVVSDCTDLVDFDNRFEALALVAWPAVNNVTFDCTVTDFPWSFVDVFPNIRYVNLPKCNLTTLPWQSVYTESLKVVDLTSCPIECNCKNQWMKADGVFERLKEPSSLRKCILDCEPGRIDLNETIITGNAGENVTIHVNIRDQFINRSIEKWVWSLMLLTHSHILTNVSNLFDFLAQVSLIWLHVLVDRRLEPQIGDNNSHSTPDQKPCFPLSACLVLGHLALIGQFTVPAPLVVAKIQISVRSLLVFQKPWFDLNNMHN